MLTRHSAQLWRPPVATTTVKNVNRTVGTPRSMLKLSPPWFRHGTFTTPCEGTRLNASAPSESCAVAQATSQLRNISTHGQVRHLQPHVFFISMSNTISSFIRREFLVTQLASRLYWSFLDHLPAKICRCFRITVRRRRIQADMSEGGHRIHDASISQKSRWPQSGRCALLWAGQEQPASRSEASATALLLHRS